MKNKTLYIFITTIIIAAFLISCSDDEDNPLTPTTAANDILLSTSLGNSSFLSTIPGLTQANVDNSNAIETTFFAYPFVHNNWLFIAPNLSSDIVDKYDIGTDGSLTKSGSLVTDQASFPANIIVLNDTKAYLTLHYGGKIIEFNPTTMQETARIDLIGSGYAVNDNNPDPGNMIVRDGKLYVALVQSSDGVTAHPGVHVLIIDINTNSIEKHIVDERGGSFCGRYGDDDAFFMDENENIYIFFGGSFGFVPGQKSGFVRINKGETDFDPNYILFLNDFNLASVDGGRIDYFNWMTYGGNNTVYGIANVPSLASSPPDFINDRSGVVVKIDLVSNTAERLNFPYSKLLANVEIYDNKLLAALSTETGVGIYTYDLSTGETSQNPVVNIQGDPLFINAL